MLWWTAAISTPPKPASVIWSISRAISSGSTRPSGHHHRNFGRTDRAGAANQSAVGPALWAAGAAAAPGEAAPRAAAAPAVTAAARTVRLDIPPRCGTD